MVSVDTRAHDDCHEGVTRRPRVQPWHRARAATACTGTRSSFSEHTVHEVGVGGAQCTQHLQHLGRTPVSVTHARAQLTLLLAMAQVNLGVALCLLPLRSQPPGPWLAPLSGTRCPRCSLRGGRGLRWPRTSQPHRGDEWGRVGSCPAVMATCKTRAAQFLFSRCFCAGVRGGQQRAPGIDAQTLGVPYPMTAERREGAAHP